jgi:hypothetical protein
MPPSLVSHSDLQAGITYVDFTQGAGVNSANALWRDAISNAADKEFFIVTFNGKRFLALVDTRWHCNSASAHPEWATQSSSKITLSRTGALFWVLIW